MVSALGLRMVSTLQALPRTWPRLISLTLVVGMALLTACAGLPPRGAPVPSQAFTDTGATALAQVASASLAAAGADAAAPSAFRLLPTGEFAFNARIALVQRAAVSIDAQYYHVHDDQAGRALLRALREAAARGVRVRLLVDDYHAGEIEHLLADLAACPGVQVRLFNPLPLRIGAPTLRLLLSPGDFERHNHRMHNKLFVADNALAIFGGRNIADEYFMNHPEANFVDLDLLGAGAVVPTLSAVFDRYWNSDTAWPVHAVLGAPADGAAAQARFGAAVHDARPLITEYRLDPLGQTAVEAQLPEGVLTLTAAAAQVFADPPTKATGTAPGRRPTVAMQGILDTMKRARQVVSIMSPYFLPGEVGMPMMREAARHGVRTVVVTNSLASTDEPLVHLHYSRYRVEMLRMGVEIYEFSPALVRRSLGFGAFGRSVPRLHAKVTVVDERWLAVGSVNLDGRSAVGNTEMSVVIDSPALAQRIARLRDGGGRGATMYKLRLQADGQTLEWLSLDEQGRGSATTDEPGNSAWQRLQLWLQSLLVDEWLL
jgi:putative cardiolipin synthase